MWASQRTMLARRYVTLCLVLVGSSSVILWGSAAWWVAEQASPAALAASGWRWALLALASTVAAPALAALAASRILRRTCLDPLDTIHAQLLAGSTGRFEMRATAGTTADVRRFHRALNVACRQIRERAHQFKAYGEELRATVPDRASAELIAAMLAEAAQQIGPLSCQSSGDGERIAAAGNGIDLKTRVMLMVVGSFLLTTAGVGLAWQCNRLLAVVLMGGGAWFISHTLRVAFAPLDDVTEAMCALSQGDTDFVADVPVVADDVGGIAQALSVLRERAHALAQAADENARRHRRQERLIRRQMQTLAETLHDGARDAVLKDLDHTEGDVASPVSGADVAAEFDALVVAYRTMAWRVREQHSELDSLVGELQDALKAKTAFIALQQELETARDLQLSILPKLSAQQENFDTRAMMIPAKEVGGDFYDFFFLSPRRVGMVIADVSGKGVPAALFMAVSRTLLKATATFGMSPGACLGKLNTLLEEGNEKGLFVTVFYGILDLDTGILTYANGGHNPPMKIAADGMVTPLEHTGGIALAVAPGLRYDERTARLGPGDTLVLYTDGVTEANNPANQEFGEDGLCALLADCGGQPSHVITERILGALRDFAAGGPQADDITCLVFHYKGATPEVECRRLVLSNDVGEIPRMTAEVEAFASARGMPSEDAFSLSFSLDELLANIISYGYDDHHRHQIELLLEYDGEAIAATLVDDGKPYDPLTSTAVPTLHPRIEERPIGGLGVFLVRRVMDDTRYTREGERNRMTIRKRITTLPPAGAANPP